MNSPLRRNASRLAAASLLAAASAAAQPQPLATQLRYEVRHFDADNNEGWQQSIEAVPGNRIEVRAVVSYIGTTTPLYGLGQITFQPLVSNWSVDDSVLTTPGTPGNQGIGPIGSNISTPPGHVPDEPGVYGRIQPFAASNTTTSTFLRGFVHLNPAGNGIDYLRISRANITNWIGVGPSSGAGASNNTIGNGGVNIVQGTIPPRVNPVEWRDYRTENIVVFKFGFLLGAVQDIRTLTITTPPAGIGRSTQAATYGGPSTTWYTTPNQSAPGGLVTGVLVMDASIHVVPATGSLTLVGLAGLTAIQRRR